MSIALNLSNMVNAYRKDGADKIYQIEDEGHVIGRLDKITRLERYTFTPTQNVTSINFNFSAVWSSSNGIYRNFTHYQGSDLRSLGVGVFISTVADMSDWTDFSPTRIYGGRGGWLKYNSSYTQLSGEVKLSTSLEANNTYYIFFYGQNTSSNWGAAYWSNGGAPTNNSTYISYTAPGAPTSLQFVNKLGNGRISNEKIEISWSGASDGTGGNTITGYQIKLGWNGKIIETGKVSKYTYTNSADSGYGEGQSITISVRAKGTVQDFLYSDWISVTGRTNTRPQPPSFSLEEKDTKLFKKTPTENISFTFEPSYESKDADGESVNCWYQIADGAWNKLNSKQFTASLSNSTTFRFRCSDGYEFSSIKEVPLEVYGLTVSEVEQLCCYQKINEESVKSITKTQLKFGTLVNVTRAPYAQVQIAYSNGKERLQTIKTDINPIIDILYEPNDSEENITYSLSVFPLFNETQTLTGAGDILGSSYKERILFGLPTQNNIKILDQWGDTNIHNSDSYKCFFEKIRVVMAPFDPQILSHDNYLCFNGKKYKLSQPTLSEGQEESTWTFEAKIPATNQSIQNQLITLSLARGNNQFYNLDLGAYSQIPIFNFDNFKIISWSDITPVFDQSNLELSLAFSEEIQKTYALPNIVDNDNDISFSFHYKEENHSLSSKKIFSAGLSTLTCQIAIDGALMNELNIMPKDYFGKKEIIGNLVIKNKYGYESKRQFSFIANFDKSPSIIEAKIKYDNKVYDKIELLEGMPLQVEYTFQQWSKNEELELLIYAWTDWSDSGPYQILKQEKLNQIENTYTGNTNTGAASFYVPEIVNSKAWEIYIQLKPKGIEAATESILIANTIPVTKPSLKLKNIEYLDGAKYKIEYEYNTQNDSDSRIVLLAYQKNSETVSVAINDNNEANFGERDPLLHSESQAVFVQVQEEFIEKTTGYSLVKTWQSNTLVAYDILPTVAYRKNRLLINSKTGSDDSVLYISRASGAHLVRLKIQNDTGQELGDLTIDLYNGSVNNALINCGTWDEIPDRHPTIGGGGGTDTIGLADIAYTGDISDLKQNTEVVIVLSGGSAPIEGQLEEI